MLDIKDDYIELFENINKNNSLVSKKLDKKKQKEISHYSTPNNIAEYMAKRLVNQKIKNPKKIKILDPGAGTGILGIILILKLIVLYPTSHFSLVAYENDSVISKLLYKNLDLLRNWLRNRSYSFSFEIKNNDYILEENSLLQNPAFKHEKNYDFIIANPPYKKVKKNSLYVETMPFIVYGASNKYSFFLAKSVIELKDNGTMAYIVPRSWMSGTYFKNFRNFIFKFGSVIEIHSFNDRNNFFGTSQVLQELVIIIFQKKHFKSINYYNHDSLKMMGKDSKISANVNEVIVGPEKKVYNITNLEQLRIANLFRSFGNRFSDIGIKMHTGLTVCFRNKKFLRNKPSENTVPIFYSQNLKKSGIELNKNQGQYITMEHPGFLQNNKNYLFIKRFSTKEEKRRIQISFYNAREFSNYSKISTDNKLNFVSSKDNELLKGVFLVMASTKFDIYYRLLNGNTQVNSSEINEMYFPSKKFIKHLSKNISINNIVHLSQQDIDNIFDTNICKWENQY